ncbi:MAG TPA: hypothetical protein VHZ52_04070 [Acidobacteriaceae bacterium]|jgi:hypothetical protein|nr:hypothetical protein [Acidobacteriaceae bacterium]
MSRGVHEDEEMEGESGSGVSGSGVPASLDFLALRVLPLASRLVPAVRRADWAREWQAELWQLRHDGRRSRGVDFSSAMSLAYGLVADAAWLRLDWTRDSMRGSAAACLYTLTAYCLLCAAMELEVAGSWHSFWHVVGAHFFGSFLFVAVPAMVAAVGTYPLRPLRCDHAHIGAKKRLSARTRWNLFLAAKIALTLILGFLATLVATVPARMVVGKYADWVELLLASVLVTVGLRWALLNQEQRCQKCLRMMGQPTRVGPPSRNFLEWNGMELVCTEGHGLLHVPEMQGSWCWYDVWVELEPGWGGIFGS